MGGARRAFVLLLSLLARTSAAQDQPAVFSRSEDGAVVVRATRIDAPLRIDGRLDEEVFQTVPAISGFVQTLPDPGAASTERTDAGQRVQHQPALPMGVPSGKRILPRLHR
jgi:hypothetical protein